ncbi:MAG TPA: hypothetical protein VFQ61_03095 [Polyangiaceae bacterium]|nr:hypothetical protein [Polyangiaceae bacterium]
MAHEGGTSRRSAQAWTKPELVAAALCGAAVLCSALGLAGLSLIVLVPVSMAALAAFVLVMPRRDLAAPSLVFFAAAGFTLIQAMPLPAGVVHAIAPRNHWIWTGAYEALGQATPRWISISLDPSASWIEVLKWLSYGAVFGAAAVLGGRRGGLWGAYAVWIAALTVAFATLLHGLAGATRVYGLYEPTFQPDRWNMGPMLNGNNLSGYLNLGALSGLGLCASRRARYRAPIAVGTAVLMAMSVLSASRAGTATLVLGVVVFAVLKSRLQEHSSPDRLGRLLLWGTLGFALLLGVVGASRATWSALSDASTDKLDIMRWGANMVGDHFAVGVGRGAYGSASFAFTHSERGLLYEYPENILVQWGAEWGAPFALVLAASFWRTLKPWGLAFKTSTVASGVCAGVFALLAQNLADFSLEVPAVGYAVALALGGCWGEYRSRRGIKPIPQRAALGLAWGVGAMGAALVILVVGSQARSASRARPALHDVYRDANLSDGPARQALQTRIRADIRMYPADPYFPRLMALVAYRSASENPLPWINRALELAMSSGRTHLLLARMLLTYGRLEQALLELRLAAEAEADLTGRAAGIAMQYTRDPELLTRAVPMGAAGAQALTQFAVRLNRPEEAQVRLRMLHEAQRRAPNEHLAWVIELQDSLTELGPGARTERCKEPEPGSANENPREACIRAAERLLLKIEKLMPGSSIPLELRAQWLSAAGRIAEAERLLAKGCRELVLPISCLRAWMDSAIRARAWSAADEAAKLILSQSCAETSRCAVTAEQLGDRLVQLGAPAAALPIYARAAREDATAGRWMKVSKVATQLGMEAQAREARIRAKQINAATP